jgi:peptidyl-prolyl cis-trans isomerase C
MTTSFPVTKTGLRFGLATALVGCLALALIAGPGRAADDPVLAKVNGAEIKKSDVAMAEEELGASLAQMDPATKDENVLSFLIDMKIVSKAAEDKKVADGDEFKKRLAFARNRLLMDSLLANEGKAATTPDAMKKVYEEASKQITGEQEVRARHILVETEEQAKSLIDELKKGGKFEDLATKNSKDPGSAQRGGDLDWNVPTTYDKQFADALVKLEKGKYTDTPVQTRFGYHIIMLEDVRPVKFPALNEVRQRISQQVTQTRIDELVKSLRAKAKVE